MRTLSIRLNCGAEVEIRANKEEDGFYLKVEQLNEIPWFTESKDRHPYYFDHSYFSGYMDNRRDLAQAFRDVANFIDGKSLIDSLEGL